jgi:hypothetical protein
VREVLAEIKEAPSLRVISVIVMTTSEIGGGHPGNLLVMRTAMSRMSRSR